MSLLDLANQCCDADGYLALGYACAQAGQCYDELRPIGNALWFSIPYRYGLPLDVLAWMQLALFAAVIITASLLFLRITTMIRKPVVILLAVLAIVILVVQIAPTFANTLSDTPATLLFMEGILLLLLACVRCKTPVLIVLGGLLLGSSALFRAAFFNPVSVAGLLLLALIAWRRSQQWVSSLLVFSFSIPLAIQFVITWEHEHAWTFLSGSHTRAQLAEHLRSERVGYDTLVTGSPFYWSPTCRVSRGLLDSVVQQDVASVACILSNRTWFYFGSYAAHTFHNTDEHNYLDNGGAESVGTPGYWLQHNTTVTLRGTESPVHDQSASILTPVNNTGNIPAASYIQSASTIPLEPGRYRYSIWLWTAAGETGISMQQFLRAISKQTRDWDDQPLAHQQSTIGSTPMQVQMDFDVPTRAYLQTRLELPAGNTSGFRAWGARLEPVVNATGYVRSTHPLYATLGTPPANSGHERMFSRALLVMNLLSLLAAWYCLFRLQQRFRSYLPAFIAAILFFMLAQAMIVLPEQRFVQAPLALSWLLALLLPVVHYSRSLDISHDQPH